jgi:hypothetical protein
MKLALSLLLVLAAPPALAANDAALESNAPVPMSEVRLGLHLVGIPWGSIRVMRSEAGGDDTPRPTLGLMSSLHWQPGGRIVAGLAAALTLNVRDDDDPADAGYMADFMLHIGGSSRAQGSINFYGYAAPGVSVVVRPDRETAFGPILGLHLGLRTNLGERLFGAIEVGGQLGMQNPNAFNLLQISLGLGWRIEHPAPWSRRS